MRFDSTVQAKIHPMTKNLMNSLETGFALAMQDLPDDTNLLMDGSSGRDDLFTKAFTMPA